GELMRRAIDGPEPHRLTRGAVYEPPPFGGDESVFAGKPLVQSAQIDGAVEGGILFRLEREPFAVVCGVDSANTCQENKQGTREFHDETLLDTAGRVAQPSVRAAGSRSDRKPRHVDSSAGQCTRSGTSGIRIGIPTDLP